MDQPPVRSFQLLAGERSFQLRQGDPLGSWTKFPSSSLLISKESHGAGFGADELRAHDEHLREHCA